MKLSIERYHSKIFMGGSLQLIEDVPVIEIFHPATGDKIGVVPDCSPLIIDEVVNCTYAVQKNWGNAFTSSQRGALLLKIADKIEENEETLAYLLTLETGKAIRTESRLEAQALKNIFRFYGGLGMEIKGETIPFNDTSFTMTIREPLGVVAAIIPWNVPLMLMAIKIAPALLTGNAVVVKSSENAPFSALKLAEIIGEFIPPHVLQVISGRGASAGEALVRHPKIAKVTFTGSVNAGRKVAANSGHQLIPVTLELGGKSPLIICEDVDIQLAVRGATMAMRFTRQGQSCTAASRIFIHKNIFDDFLAAWQAYVETLTIGDPFDEKTDIGAVITQAQYDKIKAYIDRGREFPGATCMEWCTLPKQASLASGLFIQPTVFKGLPVDHCLVKEEIFGPVVCVFSWDNFETVLKLANDTTYGLAASIWTNNYTQAMKAAQALEAGFVQINQCKVFEPGLSFGGFKQSGIGKEATLEGMLEHFTRKKTIIFNFDDRIY